MFKLGIDNIDKYMNIFEGKRVGLITNPTGITSDYVSTIDFLNKKVKLVSLFAPEHGIRGHLQAGVSYTSYQDEETGLPVYSLYTGTKKPTKEMMDELDIMCIDIQDAGSRFYTFIYSMAYAMMGCAEFGKKFVVFDRPNPDNACDFEGNILDLEYRSFVGYYPILQRHGMTIGELALLFNEEYKIGCDLTVIPMEDYDRTKYMDEFKAPWVIPSPNLPTIETAICYNTTCIFEGTNVSEGRGTTRPFEFVGAPWINALELSNKLNSLGLEGVVFRRHYFTPTFAKYANEMCQGVQVHVTDRNKFKQIKASWAMLEVIRTMYPDKFEINKPYRPGGHTFFELEVGSNYLTGDDRPALEDQYKLIKKDTKEFGKIRNKYLIY